MPVNCGSRTLLLRMDLVSGVRRQQRTRRPGDSQRGLRIAYADGGIIELLYGVDANVTCDTAP
jgi:hypothetical protein